MDLSRYDDFRQKLVELTHTLDAFHANKDKTKPNKMLKVLLSKSEEWLDLSESICGQLVTKRQLL